MLKRSLIFLAALGCLSSAASQAMTSVMVSDENLVRQAAMIAKVRILDVQAVERNGVVFTEYRAGVESSLKGTPQAAVTFRVLGGRHPSGRWTFAYGSPIFQTGDHALVFLVRHGDGTYGILHTFMGAFHAIDDGPRTLAVRDPDSLSSRSDGGEAEPARDLLRFSRWIEERLSGASPVADYWAPGARSIPGTAGRFTYFSYLGDNLRWFDFDTGGQVNWFALSGGQSGVTGGGFIEFQRALAAWNNEAATKINLHYSGTTSSDAGLTDLDAKNTINFNDPNHDLDGEFDCETGGVLARGGIIGIDDQPRNFDGKPYYPIVEGFIIVNSGLDCFFAGTPDASKAAEQLFAHELGHTLGLGHSCDKSGPAPVCVAGTVRDDALMRWNIHKDTRGARLNADDQAGILGLYPLTSLPAAPAQLSATPISDTEISLAWRDKSNNETEFHVEMKGPTGGYVDVLTLPAGSHAADIPDLAATSTYFFRVRARNSIGFSGYSNEISATTPASNGGLPAAPANLAATTVSTTEIDLTWQDTSDNETEFHVELRTLTGSYSDVLTVPAGNTSASFTDLAPATAYFFRVRAKNDAGFSEYSSEASATTHGAAAACVSGDTALCLSNGRFQVSVAYVASAAAGPGHGVSLTNDTGYFWFFAASNVELVVKLVNACSPPFNSYWVFAGGLTNVQVLITVVDTQTGVARQYLSAGGTPFAPLQDTAAFTTCP